MKFDSTNNNEMIALFLANGGAVTVCNSPKKQPKILEYNKGISARGGERGQIGPARNYRLGFPMQTGLRAL